MRRIDKVELYWKGENPTLEAMYRRLNVDNLDVQERSEIVSYLPDLKGKKVLDLGSGIGRFTRYFSSTADHVLSVERAPLFVKKNRHDHSDCANVTFLCSDVMNVELEDHSFDLIFLNWLLMYLEDDQVKILIKRIHRWLKPEGELFFRESCRIFRTLNQAKGYYAHYRTLREYDAFIKEGFVLLKDGHIQAFVNFFADPSQCYWHCKKTLSGDSVFGVKR